MTCVSHRLAGWNRFEAEATGSQEVVKWKHRLGAGGRGVRDTQVWTEVAWDSPAPDGLGLALDPAFLFDSPWAGQSPA